MLVPYLKPGSKFGVRTFGHWADRRVFYAEWAKFAPGAPLVDCKTDPHYGLIPRAFVNVRLPQPLQSLGMLRMGFSGPVTRNRVDTSQDTE